MNINQLNFILMILLIIGCKNLPTLPEPLISYELLLTSDWLQDQLIVGNTNEGVLEVRLRSSDGQFIEGTKLRFEILEGGPESTVTTTQPGGITMIGGLVEATWNLGDKAGKHHVKISIDPSESISAPSVKLTIYKKSGTIKEGANTYETLMILNKDSLVWMVDNLNWNASERVDFCQGGCLEPNSTNRLFTLDGAKMGCDVLPGDWRLPTEEEWIQLFSQYGNRVPEDIEATPTYDEMAYDALIEEGSSGFNAILSGWYDGTESADKRYKDGNNGYYWTSDVNEANGEAFYFDFDKSPLSGYSNRKIIRRDRTPNEDTAFSVRCVCNN